MVVKRLKFSADEINLRKLKSLKQINKKTASLKNNKGIALFEILPLLVVFVTLVGLTVGLWGAVHSGVLQSIAARHYAFEVINNRSHFEYHRDFEPPVISNSSVMYGNSEFSAKNDYYGGVGSRLFIIKADTDSSAEELYVTHRGINFFEELKRGYSENPRGIIPAQESTLDSSFHRISMQDDSDVQPVNPLWLMIGYGICLDCPCGDGAISVCR